MQLHICNYGGRIKEVMSKHNGCEFWDVRSSVTTLYNYKLRLNVRLNGFSRKKLI